MNIKRVNNKAIGSACGKPALFDTNGSVINNIAPIIDNNFPNEKTFIKKKRNKKAVVNIKIKLRKRKYLLQKL